MEGKQERAERVLQELRGQREKEELVVVQAASEHTYIPKGVHYEGRDIDRQHLPL